MNFGIINKLGEGFELSGLLHLQHTYTCIYMYILYECLYKISNLKTCELPL